MSKTPEFVSFTMAQDAGLVIEASERCATLLVIYGFALAPLQLPANDGASLHRAINPAGLMEHCPMQLQAAPIHAIMGAKFHRLKAHIQ